FRGGAPMSSASYVPSSRFSSGLLACTALGFVLAAESEGARAQTAPTQLSPIAVEGAAPPAYKVEETSSPKQTAPLLDTPQTITVIPKAIIQEQGLRDLTEV